MNYNNHSLFELTLKYININGGNMDRSTNKNPLRLTLLWKLRETLGLPPKDEPKTPNQIGSAHHDSAIVIEPSNVSDKNWLSDIRFSFL